MAKGKRPAASRQRVRVEFDVLVTGDRKDFSIDRADFGAKVGAFVRTAVLPGNLEMVAEVTILRFSNSSDYYERDQVPSGDGMIMIPFESLDPEVDEYHPFEGYSGRPAKVE